MIIVSHHRNAALAERKRRALASEYARVDLMSRRNGDGEFSERGRTFVWEVEKDLPKKLEIVLHFDYGDEGGKDLIRWQVHMFGPGGATDEEAIAAVKEKNRTGETPKGWKLKSIFWEKPNSAKRSGPQTDPLNRSLRKAGIAGGAARVVSRRNAVRKHRRTKRGKQATQ